MTANMAATVTLTRMEAVTRERLYEEEKQYSLIVYAVAVLLVGYVLSSTARRPAPGVPAAAAAMLATTPGSW
jgi:hypothetical protein